MINSAFATLFIALQERIKEKVSEIRYIDLDTGQLNEERPSVSFPAVLISIDSFSFENLVENKQVGEGTVSFKIVTDTYSNTNSLTPEEWKAKALDVFNLEWAIYKALHNWKPSAEDWQYGYLNRDSTHNHVVQQGLIIRESVFSLNYEDDKAVPEYTTTRLNPLEIESTNLERATAPGTRNFKVKH